MKEIIIGVALIVLLTTISMVFNLLMGMIKVLMGIVLAPLSVYQKVRKPEESTTWVSAIHWLYSKEETVQATLDEFEDHDYVKEGRNWLSQHNN